MLGFPRPLATLLTAAACVSTLAATDSEWTEYGACVLTPGARVLGDSLDQVVGLKSGGKRPSALNWRLYGVECPRAGGDASAFGVTPESLPEWERQAKEFVEDFLAEPFFVYTKSVPAREADGKPRYYAIVVGADRRALHEALLEAGLARVAGPVAAWPEGTGEAAFAERLRSLEAKARESKTGIWSAASP